METSTVVDQATSLMPDKTTPAEYSDVKNMSTPEAKRVQDAKPQARNEVISNELTHSKGLFKAQKRTVLALFVRLLACFPGFTNPQRDDVIVANQVLNYGVGNIQPNDMETVKEAMDSAKSFYSKYARLLGFGIGAGVSVFVEWVQAMYPDYQVIRAAHAGSGVVAGWVVSNIMSEYERRIHQLKEQMR